MKWSLLVLLGSAALASAADPKLSVGFGEVDVSPTVGETPVYMAGFGTNRKATRVHDPIMARAIVLSDGTKKIGMVCVDVVGLFYPSVERVRGSLKGFDYVLVSSTHNHEAPDTLGLWGASPFQSGVDPAYLKKVEDGAAEAIRLADSRRQACSAEIGTAKGPELLRDGRQPIVKHDDIVVLRFTAGSDKPPVGILVEWNCHPETLDSKNTEVSADFVHGTVEYLKAKHRCPVAYFTGTVGGLMTSLDVEIKNAKGESLKDGTFEKTIVYGRKVGELADKALKDAVAVNLTPFDLRTRPILMPVENSLYKLGASAGVLKRTFYHWDGKWDAKEFTEAKDITKSVAVKSEIGYLKLGDLDIAAIPGEIYPELVLGKVQDPVDPNADFPKAPIEPSIYGQLTGKHRMLIGLANDELGYFIPKRQWDEKAPFCYGLKKSQYGEINSVGPEAAPIICEAFRRLTKNAP